jgi:autotransporter-associated beta strand protein/parallel beta-helix repeat protein
MFHLWRSAVLGRLCLPRRARRAASVTLRARPRLEELEGRVVPTTWTVNAATDSSYLSGGSGSGTTGDLRYCLTKAGNGDTVAFHIGSNGSQQDINVEAALPAITHSITIDGTTQASSYSTPLIHISGTNLSSAADGLDIRAGNVTVKGLVINRFSPGNGIHLDGAGATGDVIVGNWIGTNTSGGSNSAAGNQTGILIDGGAYNNTIGGTTAGDRNVISNNTDDGVKIASGSTGNLIEGNFIGTDYTGAANVGNGEYGVYVLGSNNTVGGSSSVVSGKLAGAGNVVSGNTQGGVILEYGSGNKVQGNFVGTDVTGTSAIPNNPTGKNKNNDYLDGIDVIDGSYGATIGGASTLDANGNLAGLGNLVSGNGFDGVFIGNWFSSGYSEIDTFVQGNFVGTTVTGTKKLANYSNGVELGVGAYDTTIGGSAAGTGNLLSGNGSLGLEVSNGGDGSGAATMTTVQGNEIGTTVAGTANLANAGGGVSLDSGSSSTTLGGATASTGLIAQGAGSVAGLPAAYVGNLISGNTDDGIDVSSSNSNLIEGNVVGLDRTATTGTGTGGVSLGNGGSGLVVSGTSSGITIGGLTGNAGNVIANNGTSGTSGDDYGIDLTGTDSTTLWSNNVSTDRVGSQNLDNTSNGLYLDTGVTGTIGAGSTFTLNIPGGPGSIGGPGRLQLAANVTLNDPQIRSGTTVRAAGSGDVLNNVPVNGLFDMGGNAVTFNSFTGSGTVTNSGPQATLTVTGGGSYGGYLTGNLGLTDDGTPTLVLTGVSTYNGGTTVSQGTLQLGASNALPAGGVVTVGDYANSYQALLNLNGHSQAVAGLTFYAPDSATTALTLGAGTLTLNGPLNYLNSAGGNGAGNNYPVVITATGAGHIDLGGAVRAFNVAGNNNNSNTPTNPVGGDLQINAPIQDGGVSFSQTSAGYGGAPAILALTAANTYAGGTTVNSGTLLVTGAISSGPVTLNPAGALDDQVIDTASSGVGSLRQAVLNADEVVGVGPNTSRITFDIPGSGTQVITPASPGLPAMTSPVTLDGTSQPGYAGSPLVQIVGSSAGSSADGLSVTASNVTIQGLSIVKFKGEGILVTGADDTLIQENLIGTDPAGDAGLGNGLRGIYVVGQSNAYVTGTQIIDNVSSDNGFLGSPFCAGVRLDYDSGTLLEDNLLGTDPSGEHALGNAGYGVHLYYSYDDTLTGNTIADNGFNGRDPYSGVYGQGDEYTQIEGNYIGTDEAGEKALGNAADGVDLDDSHDDKLSGNFISGNAQDGVYLENGADDNVLTSNLIGTDAGGTLSIPNGTADDYNAGVYIDNSPYNTIGGSTAAARNVISGNGSAADPLVYGVYVTGSGAHNNFIEGDYIGVDATGLKALGNARTGVALINAPDNTVGGLTGTPGTGPGNVIAANGESGVYVQYAGSSGDAIEGNLIGTNATGLAGLGGQPSGGVTLDGAPSDTVGGSAAGAGNVLSGNTGPGVWVLDQYDSGTGTNDTVAGNWIGTDVNGATGPTAGTANGGGGVEVLGPAGNATIGSRQAAGYNVIAGNTGYGIWLTGGTANDTLLGNLVGVDPTGMTDEENTGTGVEIDAGVTATLAGRLQIGLRPVVAGLSGGGAIGGGGKLTLGSGAVLVNPKILPGFTIQAVTPGGTLTNVSVDGALDLDGEAVSLSLYGGDVSTGTVTDSGGAATLTVTGGGTFGPTSTINGANTALTVDGGNQTLVLEGVDNYHGLTTINATDTLEAGAANAFSASSALYDYGTLDLGGFSNAVGGLFGTGVVTSTAPASSSTLNVTGGGNFPGQIEDGPTGQVALLVSGMGQTLTLGGANSYSGGTTVTAATLVVSADGNLGAVPSAPVTNITLGGGTLESAAANVSLNANRNLLLAAGGTLNSNTVGDTLTVGGAVNGANALTLTGPGGVTFAGTVGGSAAPTSFTQAAGAGAVTFDASTTVGSGGATFDGNVAFGGPGVTFASAGSAVFGLTSANTLTVGGAGPVAITTTNKGVTLNAATTATQSLTFSLGTGAFTQSAGATIGVGANALTVSAGTVTLNANVSATGGGTIGVTASTNIAVSGGATVSTVGGNLTLSANQGTPAAGNFVGVNINAATVESATGAVLLQGKGGSGSGQANYGVAIEGTVTTLGSGSVTVLGAGGASSGNYADGVVVLGTLTSGGGNLTVTGTGGGTGSSQTNVGVTVEGAFAAGGTGAVAVSGTGGATSGGADFGVVVIQSYTITSGGGNVTVIGTGGGTGPGQASYGVEVEGTVTAGGSGAVTVMGAAGDSADNTDYGAFVSSTGKITSGGGNLTVAGTGVVDVATGGTLTTGSGALTLTGDVIDLGAANSVSTTGSAELFFQPQTASRPIVLGGGDTSGSLVFTTADRAAIASGFSLITIGSAGGAGAVTTASNLTAFTSNVTLQTPGAGSGGIKLSNTLNDGGHTLILNSGSTISQAGGGLVEAATADLTAPSGIGASGNALALQVGALTADSSGGNGNQFLAETGTAQLAVANALNAGSGAITLAGGTFQITAGAAGNAIADASPLTLNAPAVLDLGGYSNTIGALNGSGLVTDNGAAATLTVSGAGTFSGVLEDGTSPAGSLGFIKSGAGTQTLSGTAANTATGTTTVTGGTLSLNKSAGVNAVAGPLVIGDGVGGADADVVILQANEQIGNAAAVTVTAGSGLFNLNGNSETVGSLAGGGDVTLGGGTLTTGTASSTFGGVLSGAGGLTKTGAGNFTFSGAGSVGQVTVSGGTLTLGSAGSLTASGGLGVTGGGALAGTGTVTAAVNNAGQVNPGGTAPGGTLTINGAYTQTSAGALNVRLGGAAQYDALAVSGAATLGGTLDVSLPGGFTPAYPQTFTVLTFGSKAGDFTTETLPSLGGGVSLQADYLPPASPTNLTLALVYPPPTSSVSALPAFSPSPFTVSWSGAAATGVGLASYTIYVSDDNGPFTPWLTNTTLNSAAYTAGVDGHTYGFYSVAKDNAGDVQLTPTAAQASTTVDTTPPTSSVNALPATTTTPSFTVSWSGSDTGSGVATFDVYASVDGAAFTLWQAATAQTSAVYPGQYGHSYAFYSLATDNVNNRQTAAGPTQSTTVVSPLGVASTSTVAALQNHTTGLVSLATFSDANGVGPLGGYSATINWNDGSPIDTSAGANVTISTDGAGHLVVSGLHTYATGGAKAPTVTLFGDGTSLQAAPTIDVARDVSASVGATSSGLVLNRGTQLWVGTITITNTSSTAVTGPLQVVLTGLTGGTLANASGYDADGDPYLTVTPPGGVLLPGQSLTFTVQFKKPNASNVLNYGLSTFSDYFGG